jgi:tRNA 2-thiouridine synthesizing protein A
MTKEDPDTPPKIASTLNIKGMQCPMPLYWARSQVDALKPGEMLEVLATDPTTIPNFEAFCRQTGNRLVEASETDGVFRLLIEKAA